MAGPLDGQVALVTGAGGAIGAACAAGLARDGAAVALTDLDLDAAEAAAETVRAAGGNAVALRHDVASAADWDTVMRATHDALGPVSIMHSNAAATSSAVQSRDTSVLDMDVDLWDLVMAVNVRGAMLACKHAVRDMSSIGSGSIVITTSLAATLASLHPAYSASKGALISLMRSVATMHGPARIRCNAVAPGFIESAATSLLSDAQRADLTDANRIPDPGLPRDVANVVRFLAGSSSSFMTGQVLVADGGMSIHLPNIRRGS